MNNEQKELAHGCAYGAAKRNGPGAIIIAGTRAHEMLLSGSAKNPRQRTLVGSLFLRDKHTKKQGNYLLTRINSCTKGQIAHSGSASPRVRESSHGIIRCHRIRFALFRVCQTHFTSPRCFAMMPPGIIFHPGV